MHLLMLYAACVQRWYSRRQLLWCVAVTRPAAPSDAATAVSAADDADTFEACGYHLTELRQLFCDARLLHVVPPTPHLAVRKGVTGVISCLL